jgi:biopolymer transport protein ExbD
MDFSPDRKRRSILINVTSLIDVMFLLVLFFMLSSTFKTQAAINLVLPRSTTAEQVVESPTVVYLTVNGQVFLDNEARESDDLRVALRQVQAGTGEDRIVLTADEGAPHGKVVELIDLIKECGFTRISLTARKP